MKSLQKISKCNIVLAILLFLTFTELNSQCYIELNNAMGLTSSFLSELEEESCILQSAFQLNSDEKFAVYIGSYYNHHSEMSKEYLDFIDISTTEAKKTLGRNIAF